MQSARINAMVALNSERVSQDLLSLCMCSTQIDHQTLAVDPPPPPPQIQLSVMLDICRGTIHAVFGCATDAGTGREQLQIGEVL